MTETLDWAQLTTEIVPNTKKISFEENRAKFTKIAFDVWKSNDSCVESLWILETDDKDGKQYLVAKYENDEQPQPLEAKSDWNAIMDNKKENITVAFKNHAIQRFASSDFGFTSDDAYIFQHMLIEKLSSDKTFVKKLIESLPKEKQEILLTNFPELI